MHVGDENGGGHVKNTEEIPLNYIQMLPEVQPRTKLSDEKIEEYAKTMEESAEFPPVVVFRETGNVYVLADGFHRVRAARKAAKKTGLQTITCIVKPGSVRDAQLFAVHANAEHGLPLTQAEKRMAVEKLLRDDVWKKWSNNKIGKWCGVSGMTVGRIKGEMGPHYNNVKVRICRDKHGNVIEMKTGKIGRGARAAASQPGRPGGSCKGAAAKGSGELYRVRPFNKDKTLWVARAVDKDYEEGINTTNDDVEWARRTWSPVTGCRNGCDYCYARSIAESGRFPEIYPVKFEPCFHSSRIKAPLNHKPANPDDFQSTLILTCSTSDLFGPLIPDSWIQRVMDTVRNAPWWNFLFLSKFPERMALKRWRNWPNNAWVGATVDCDTRVKPTERAFEKIKAKVKFVACEPLGQKIEQLGFEGMGLFQWVIIGGQDETVDVKEDHPRAELVESLVRQARNAGCAVYLKPNLKYRPQEYPSWQEYPFWKVESAAEAGKPRKTTIRQIERDRYHQGRRAPRPTVPGRGPNLVTAT
jgi:protein gp37/uncharacterized ParB-like nuclease family protein